MSDPISIFPLVLVLIFGALGIILAVRLAAMIAIDFAERRSNQRETWADFEAQRREQAKPKAIPMFCKDCGKNLVSLRSQEGFDMQTGAPKYTYERACSDGTRNPGDIKATYWPFCGVRTLAQAVPNAHNHEGDGPETTCPTCLDTMVESGILRPEAALPLYDKANASLGRSEAWESRERQFIGRWTINP